MKITDSVNDQLMVTAAHRYCLGRRTYIVSACLEWLYATWDQFTSPTKVVMLRDTAEALMEGHAGSETIDAPGWEAFLAWGMNQMSPEQQQGVKRRVLVNKREWPLPE